MIRPRGGLIVLFGLVRTNARQGNLKRVGAPNATPTRTGQSVPGTTMLLIHLLGSDAYVAHVGDTGIYHVRGSGIVSH